ncbi:MAG: PEP-utilizing enzyme [Candidatus Sumerlaeia bacterium]|nr:PEP-utilizing enzyme [Candidatus Sumerlaeia bacterium]
MKDVFRRLRHLFQRRPDIAAPSADLSDLKLRYREFKDLLQANNEVLALIAQIEMRRSEDGALGLDFIRSRYALASTKVHEMILHLNRISDHAYPSLFDAHNRIRRQIELALSQGVSAESQELVLPLAAADYTRIHQTGSKAANLGWLLGMGLPARDGFVITTAAFRLLMQKSGLADQVHREWAFLKDYSYVRLATMSRRWAFILAGVPLPAELGVAIRQGLADLFERLGGPCRLSVRSSAVGEDMEASYAGQYRTELNVPPEGIFNAYRAVVASIYNPQAILYRHQMGLSAADAEMAVLVMPMIYPVVSGVLYTRDPRQGEQGPILITAVYGLARGLVEGWITPDHYSVSREPPMRILDRVIAKKTVQFVAAADGVRQEDVPPELARQPALTDEQVERLAALGLKVESLFGEPQDIEWSMTAEGKFVVLQSRPLRLLESKPSGDEPSGESKALLLSGGQCARPGAGSGPAFIVKWPEDLQNFPDGAVLVAANSSPAFSSVFNRATAVVTEVGGITGHMASLARELGVPAIVGIKGALKAIPPGEVITVDATAGRIYQGRVESVLARRKIASRHPSPGRSSRPGPLHAADLITPLTLTDPHSPAFRPESCRTFHDLIRFVHEKSFTEMFFLGDRMGEAAREEARKLAHPLPFEVWVIDLGGGLTPLATPSREVVLADVYSRPGKAFLEGLLDPRIRWNQPRPVSLRGFMSVFSTSLLHTDPDEEIREIGQKAFMIVSPEYLNFNSRVGYHFAALDSVCGLVQNDNYISFAFQGGAAAPDRRTLRAELISLILSRQGFSVEQEGDQVHAFLKKYDAETTARLLADLGRLLLFTRQMDMLIGDRRMVAWLAQAFEEGNYNLDG